MKISVLLTCLLAAVLPALPLSQARADDVSFDVFYNSLSDQGDWYNTPDFGYVWQPSIAYQNDKWRPYSDGYWAQTDDGWTWVSYENFGWATYHYGRWTNLEGTGWVWVPGYEWGPGWVSWRTSDDYVGWAPLPPRRESTGGGGASVTVDYNTVEPEEGYNAAVDQQYDIGPTNYCFVETRYFGAPVLSAVLLPPQRNVVIIENTINVTDIRYNRGGPRVVVYNGGPDFAFISGHVDRPIQRLRIEQNNSFDYAHVSRDRNPNVVRDGVFRIAAPTIAPRPVNFAQVRPATVKRDIRDPRIEHGWSNTGADQATVQRLHQQFQQQAREVPARPPGANPAAAGFTAPGRPPGNAPGGFTPPANDARQRDARSTVPTTPPANPAAVNTPPHGNTDADRRARRDAAQHERDERDGTHANGGAPNPAAAPGGQPFNPPNAPRRGPNTPETVREPSAPAPERETTPSHEGRNRVPASSPESAPANTPHADRHPARPDAATNPPSNATEEVRHTPRQPERAPTAPPPTRNTEGENRPERAQEQERVQTPPPAPRQEPREIRENRPAATPPPAPAARPEVRAERQEVREPRQATQPASAPRPEPQEARQAAPSAPRQEAHENRESKSPANAADDQKKKRDGQQ